MIKRSNHMEVARQTYGVKWHTSTSRMYIQYAMQREYFSMNTFNLI